MIFGVDIDGAVWLESGVNPCKGCVRDGCCDESGDCYPVLVDYTRPALVVWTHREVAAPCRECGEPVERDGLCGRCLRGMEDR